MRQPCTGFQHGRRFLRQKSALIGVGNRQMELQQAVHGTIEFRSLFFNFLRQADGIQRLNA